MANIKITHTKALPKSSNPNEDRTLDREKEELFPLRRLLAFHHNAGGYEKALKIGLELQEKITEIYGTNNTVYASCLSNIALMVGIILLLLTHMLYAFCLFSAKDVGKL